MEKTIYLTIEIDQKKIRFIYDLRNRNKACLWGLSVPTGNEVIIGGQALLYTIVPFIMLDSYSAKDIKEKVK